MGKAKAPRRLADNEARAVLRTIRVSPQKLNLVAALIRGKEGGDCARRSGIFPEAYRGNGPARRWNWRSPTQKTITTSTSMLSSSRKPLSASRSS